MEPPVNASAATTVGDGRLRTIHAIARGALGFAWIYHGLIPKILFPNTGEVDISLASGIPRPIIPTVNFVAGIAECVFGIVILVLWRHRWPLIIQIPVLFMLLGPIALTNASLFTRPFGPMTENLLMIALAAVGLLATAPDRREAPLS